MARQLPGYGSPYVGPDARTSSLQWFRQRRKELPEQNTPWLTSVEPLQALSSLSMTANRAIFIPIDYMEKDFVAKGVILNVTVLAVGAQLHTALYSYNSELVPRLQMIPSSYVDFSTTTTGIKRVELSKSCAVPKGTGVFMGFMTESAVAKFGAISVANSPVHVHYKDSATVLDETVNLGELSTPAAVIPCIMYLSDEGWKIY